jgi:hypothetical protein
MYMELLHGVITLIHTIWLSPRRIFS